MREFVKDKDEKNTMKCNIGVFQRKREDMSAAESAATDVAMVPTMKRGRESEDD